MGGNGCVCVGPLVSMSPCACVYTVVCVFTRVHVCGYARTRVGGAYVCSRVVYVGGCTYGSVHVRACVYVCVHVCTCL